MDYTQTPEPPYYVVIFISKLTDNLAGYAEALDRMSELVSKQPGYYGEDAIRTDELGISVIYWKDEESIKAWRENPEHRKVQKLGIDMWYESYFSRVAKVERDNKFEAGE